jgi:hypothetical protein
VSATVLLRLNLSHLPDLNVSIAAVVSKLAGGGRRGKKSPSGSKRSFAGGLFSWYYAIPCRAGKTPPRHVEPFFEVEGDARVVGIPSMSTGGLSRLNPYQVKG